MFLREQKNYEIFNIKIKSQIRKTFSYSKWINDIEKHCSMSNIEFLIWFLFFVCFDVIIKLRKLNWFWTFKNVLHENSTFFESIFAKINRSFLIRFKKRFEMNKTARIWGFACLIEKIIELLIKHSKADDEKSVNIARSFVTVLVKIMFCWFFASVFIALFVFFRFFRFLKPRVNEKLILIFEIF